MKTTPLSLFLMMLALTLASLACSSQADPTAVPTYRVAITKPAITEPPAATSTALPTAKTPRPSATSAQASTPTQPVASPTLSPAASDTPTPSPTLALTAPPFNRTLWLQSPRLQGNDVLLMQQRLVELGYSEVGTPDGIFGPMTEAAVIRFQTNEGLTADGVVGPLTWAALWGADCGAPVAAEPPPTSEYAISRTLRAPNFPVKHISVKDNALWVITPGDTLSRLDPETGAQLGKYAIGCKVCYGACELLAATRDGDQFWTLQYGSLKEEDCNANDPWQYVGFMLRKMKPDSNTFQVIGVSQYLQYAPFPEQTSLAVKDGKIWLGLDTAIYVIDADESDEEKLVTLKAIYPGISVRALLYADDKMWAAGEALVAIDPETYNIIATYPLDATALAFDGERIWGVSEQNLWVRGVNIATRQLTAPIPLGDSDLASAIAFDGKNLWVAFAYSNQIVVIPIRDGFPL